MRPENVLLVDDNDLLRSVMIRLLTKMFQHVSAVGNGTDALQQIGANFYHVVILDKNLPDIDGLDVLKYVTVKSPHSRVVMITSDLEAGIRQEALNRGALEFFEKPLDVDKLRIALRGKRICKQVQARIDERHRGMTHDISYSGMLVNTNVVFQCGATVDVLLHVSDDVKIPLKGTVVRTADSTCIPSQSSSAGDTMRYAVGMQLVNPPSDYYSFVESLIL
jgi:DNA-binding NtrC family response regulator